MEIFLIKLLQFLLAISLLVLLHEGGHFFFSKLFGVRVEKFYMFFDAGIGKWDGSLLKWKPKKSDTQYGIGWLPLGGYCKIAGMIDESFDTDQMKQPEQPWEFRTKPAWQRLLIMIGGVLVNFLLALFIYAMVLFTWGETYVPTKDMTLGMKFNQEAKALGFEDGDILLGTDRGTFKAFTGDVYRDLSKAREATVLRNGTEKTIAMPGNLNLLDMLQSTPRFVAPLVPAVVDSILTDSPAAASGMQKGDKIVAINGKNVDSFNELTDQLGRLNDALVDAKTSADSLSLRQVTLAYERYNAADTITFPASITLTEDMKIGFMPRNIIEDYTETHVSYSFFESFPAGVKYGWHVLGGYVSDMKYVFTKSGAKSLGGFGTIGNLFPATWDWHAFWMMTAFLSIILAFMNILPIPALDGGHVLFLIYEMITGRKPSDDFMVKAEYVGFGIVILLLIVANLNDVLRWIGVM